MGSWLDRVARDPKNPKNWRDLAEAHFKLGELREAILHYSQAIRLDPEEWHSWLRIAHAQERLGMIDDSVASYKRAITLRPSDANAQLTAAAAMPRIIASDKQIRAFRQAMITRLNSIIDDSARFDAGDRRGGNTGFFCAYHNENNRDLKSLLARAHLSVFPDLAWRAPHCNRTLEYSGSERIKLGVASNFLFSGHTIGKLNIGWMKRICRDKFELINIRRETSHQRDYAEIDATADRVLILPRDLRLARQALAELKLDVLHYPDVGMSSFFYLLAFARLAPIQTTSWGHPDTTGIQSIDCFISSRCLEPSNAASLYSEKLILLDGPPTYYCRPSPPARAADRRDFDLPKSGGLYACPHSLFRLHPDFDGVLGAILRREAQAHVVMISDEGSGLTKLLLRRLSTSIPDVVDRIIFLPSMNTENWLNFLRIVDCVLDPDTFSGGNTSYEALAMGTPVVTWANAPFLRGRITLALYQMMGISECIAHSIDEYVEIVERLTRDPVWRCQVVQSIRNRSPLIFDDGGYDMVRSLERFWEDATHARLR